MIYVRPKHYITASTAVSLAGLCNGFDTGTIGALTTMPQFTASIGRLSPSLLGFTVSLVQLTGAIPSVFAGHLADRHGRLKVIFLGAMMYAVGALLQGTSYTLAQFLVGRAIDGLGQGVFLSNASVYICEIAPAKYRGPLAGLPQFMSTGGICLGYFTCYGSVRLRSSISWRAPYIFQVVLGLALCVSCWTLPESPRWLMNRGAREQALESLQRLDFDMTEAYRDFLATPSEPPPSLSMWQSIAMLFRRAYRARTILALFILGMVQLSGIDAITYYTPVLFAQAGLSGSQAKFLASGVSAILMLAISVPGFLLADRWGRRASAISGGVILSSLMFLIGSLYAAQAVHSWGSARWVVIVSVFAFGLTYCVTWGIVGKIYAAEIQPGHTRAAANCVAQGLGFFTNWVVAILTPILLDKSAFGAYFLFGGLSLGTVIVLAAYMPETRGRSLEAIQDAFHQPAFGSAGSVMLSRIGFRKGFSSEACEQPAFARSGSGSVSMNSTMRARGLEIVS